jgi:hypothetical protein
LEEGWDVMGAVEDLVEEFVHELVGVLDLVIFDFLEDGFMDFSLDVWMEKEEIMWGWDVLVFVRENGVVFWFWDLVIGFVVGYVVGFVIVKWGCGIMVDALEDDCHGMC